MAPKRTTSSHCSQASNDNAPFRFVGNVNVPLSNKEKVVVPPPSDEGMAQDIGNLERLIEL